MSFAFEMPQIMTLCGIQPEQSDIDFSYRGLDAADAKLLAFDLSKNRTVKTVKYAAARKCSLLCQRPLTEKQTPFCAHRLWNNNLGPEGGAALAEGLKGNSTLQSLE